MNKSSKKLGMNAAALLLFILLVLFCERVLGIELNLVVELVLLTIYLLLVDRLTGNKLF